MKPNKRTRLTGDEREIRNANLLAAINDVGVIAAAHRFKLSSAYVYKIRDRAKLHAESLAPMPKIALYPDPLNLIGAEPKKPTVPIFDEAAALIYGDREKEYGDPLKNLDNIAAYWETYLRSRGLLNPDRCEGLAYFDVCRMMELVKIARLGNAPFARDSSVDVCGYEGLIDRIRSE